MTTYTGSHDETSGKDDDVSGRIDVNAGTDDDLSVQSDDFERYLQDRHALAVILQSGCTHLFPAGLR